MDIMPLSFTARLHWFIAHWHSGILAWQLLRRDWRSGHLWLLALALVLTAAMTTTVGSVTQRLMGAFQQQGSQLLAADLALDSGHAFLPAIAAYATQLGLRTAAFTRWRSVLLVSNQTQLVEIKAVTPDYPLRGQLRWQFTAAHPEQTHRASDHWPLPAGHVWLEPRLLTTLALKTGDTVKLGRAQFIIAGSITLEPDRGANLFNYAPRVLMNASDVAATALVTPLSRVRHRLLIAGEPAALRTFSDWVRPQLSPDVELLNAQTARPELTGVIERAVLFLHLAAIITVIIAGAAIALASRRFIEQQAIAVAIMRTLGAPQHRLFRLLLMRLGLLGLLTSAVGCLLGYITQYGFTAAFSEWLNTTPLPPINWQPLLLGLGTGGIALAGFALPPLVQLQQMTPLRVLRRDVGTPRSNTLLTAAGAGGALVLLLIWQINDIALAGRMLLGILVAFAVFVAFGFILVKLAGMIANYSSGIWRLGLTNLAQRPHMTILQVTGLGLGLFALALLVVIRVELLPAWQRQLPAHTPNQFLINIPGDIIPALQQTLTTQGIRATPVYPMIRGRLIAIAGHPIRAEQFTDARARRLVEREFNLSVATDLQPDNHLIAGKWWLSIAEQQQPQFSVEAGLATTLDIQLGDELRFWLAGREIAAPVTSLRQVQWDSFNVNFFVIASPALLATEPATFITSFYLPPTQTNVIATLLAQFPMITPIDVAALLQQVQMVIAQGVTAMEYLFLFTVIAGGLVIATGIQLQLTTRRRDLAVLRTLGATQRQVITAFALELTVLGAATGFIAVLFAVTIATVVAHQLLHLTLLFTPWLWFMIIGVSAVFVGGIGTAVSYRVLIRPPLVTLRQQTE